MIYLNDDIAHFDWQGALPLLSEQRREQCLRFKFELGRQTCAAAYLLLREALSKEYGIAQPPVFEYGEHGKPMIAGQPHIHFNLSHCREAAICVLSDQPVGCDIESIRKFKESLVRYTMTDDEQALIAQSPQPDRAFVRLWTQKEAVLKLIGTGITDNLKNVLTTFTGHLETIASPDKNYIYSIARAGETKHVKL